MSGPKLGFALPVSGSWATRENVATIAQLAEQAGYESLWTFQRLLHPVDADWPPVYRSVTDPLITLAYVAALTTRPRLGVAILNAPYAAPIVMAKQLATLDELSQGRLDAGFGAGWAPEEFTATGADFARRGARIEEFVQCLKAIWTNDKVSFTGEFYQIPASSIEPKPTQRPHPPLLLGGDADHALKRVGRIADGWISRSRHDLTKIGTDIEVIKAAALAAGRDPQRLRFIVRGVVQLKDDHSSETSHSVAGNTSSTARDGRRPLHGTAGQIKQDLAILGEHGVTEVFLDLNFVAAVGDPKADPVSSMKHAIKVLETFAPAGD